MRLPGGTDGGVGREDGEDSFRCHASRHEQEQGDARADQKCAGQEFPYGIRAALAPVLTSQHDNAVAHAHHELLKNELDLIDGADAGHGDLAVRADHDVIGEVDAQCDDVIQHQHGPDGKEALVERRIADERIGLHDKQCLSDRTSKSEPFPVRLMNTNDLYFLLRAASDFFFRFTLGFS